MFYGSAVFHGFGFFELRVSGCGFRVAHSFVELFELLELTELLELFFYRKNYMNAYLTK